MLVGVWRNWDPHRLLWGCKMGPPVWETVWYFLKNRVACDPTIQLLGLHPREIKISVYTKPCIPSFVAVLFVVAKK